MVRHERLVDFVFNHIFASLACFYESIILHNARGFCITTQASSEGCFTYIYVILASFYICYIYIYLQI